MLSRFPKLPIAAAVLLACGYSAAQSSQVRCAVLNGQFEDDMLGAYSNKAPDDYASQDYEQRFSRWQKQQEGHWQRVIDSGRRYLGECSDGSSSVEADVLKGVAEGLKHLGRLEDAIPILRRCLSIDPDKSSCWDELGNVEMGLCAFDDARESFQHVIQVGGFTRLNAALVDSAKSDIALLENPRAVEGLRTRWGCPTPPGGGEPGRTTAKAERFGTGFFVTKHGHILTNNHVVDGCKTLTTRDGKALEVIDRDVKADLALLKVDAAPDLVATFRSGPPPKQGDAVVAFGFPLPDLLSSEGNVSSGILSATTGLQDDVRFVQISAPVQPGNSGGPLMDASGHVWGVVVAKLDALKIAHLTGDVPQNVNFAVHWAVVRAFLDQGGVAYRQASSPSHSEIHDVAAEARRFSVGIACTE
jgi:S1-C subfamily serine protease